MPTCQNINRYFARNWHEQVSPKEYAWISIEEPEIKESVVSNKILNELPTLRLGFWDVTEIIYDIGGKPAFPPSEYDAAKIISFINKNLGKKFIINCRAGKSRSSAICKFLEKNFGYRWIYGKDIAAPNPLLFKLLEQEQFLYSVMREASEQKGFPIDKDEKMTFLPHP